MSTQESDAAKIFLDAVEYHEPDRRSTFVDDACEGNPQLRARVFELLRAHGEPNALLDDEAALATLKLSPLEKPGTQIGPYKLLQQIGEGGFGVVYMAEQERPVKRRVALKLIKPGMDTREVIARFEAERQALAMMDHPNIAKVYDAGATENGRPYFVMELVQGVPITEYCDQCNLTNRERLELFVAVCQAVQHAHQKGIIHRDIKPTNVLVAIQDGRPAPKIIDFGVAKAINQQLTERTLMTAFAQIVGTPLYMSPEQAELSPLGVDTRSDIYSLGVLLYELLSGTTPFDKDRLRAATYDELRHIIREEEPPLPSARISTLSAGIVTTIAERRRTDPRRLRQTVRGELDWMAMKCLEKDRNRRYESAGSIARDIERYLHDEPVDACPPSVAYRLKKYVRRNKVAAAFVAMLLIGMTGLGVSNIAIKRERDAKTAALAQATTESTRAQAVSGLLQEMLGSADTERAKGTQYTVRELLDDFSGNLGGQLADQPEVEADIQAIIARAYRSLNLPAKARPHFEKAIELRRHIDGPDGEELAAVLADYAWNLLDLQRYVEAESQVHEALEIFRQRGAKGRPVFHAMQILQHILISSAHDIDAERVTEEALDFACHAGEEFPEQATLLHRYADLKIRQGCFADGEKLARQSVDMHRRLHGDHHPETAYALRTLAAAFVKQQKLTEAGTALRESVAIFRREFPANHRSVRGAVDELKAVLEAAGDLSALEALANEEAELAMRSELPENHVRLAGLLLTNQAGETRKEEARRQIRMAIEGYGRLAGDNRNGLDVRLAAVGQYLEVARVCAAVPGYASELDEVNRILNRECSDLLAMYPDPADTVDILYGFGLAHLRLGDKASYRQICEAMSHVPSSDVDDKGRRTWIWCLGPHTADELKIPLNEAREGLAIHDLDARHSELLGVGGMLYRAGQYEQAAHHLEEFSTVYPSDPPRGDATINYQLLLLAMTKWQLGQKDEGRHLLAEAQSAVDKELQSPLTTWNRRATLELLRHEADNLIGRREADEAVKKETPTNNKSK